MRYVKYIGLAHQRMITPGDWRTVGVNGETAVWNAQNGFSVPLDRFSEDQIRKAIEPDANFIITDDTPTPQPRDMVPAEAAQAAQADGPAVPVDEDPATPSVDDSEALPDDGADRSTPANTSGGGPAPAPSKGRR
jgi:hypothetical protein